MTDNLGANEIQATLRRWDGLLQEAEQAADPAARGRLRDIVQSLLEVHGAGLRRLLEHVRAADDCGERIVDECARDEVVSGLLLLHGLHPHDVEARVRHALETVRPALRSHGGSVKLLEVIGGVVRLRLEGSCGHCSSSAATMQNTVEEAIYARAPEVELVEVEQSIDETEPGGVRLALPIV
jgi:Fe-S cluster biogenesis protein NfuA